MIPQVRGIAQQSQPWYGKWTKGRMIQFNSTSPYANARGRIRKWLRDTA
ncbi:ClbS/DfsB family four-helix bundle protein [Pseudogemmobacter sonorensis]